MSRGSRPLEGEMEENTWILSQVKNRFVEDVDGLLLWKKFLLELGSKYQLDAQAPEDPSVN